ncbi:MAG: hypothetical protein Ct9H300mP28_11500 [Pseudomonadota bacterium]|nr:MAG: hypothetical protein Ct9H300mP28_11500 [Pseudomonadota bacterium]
MVQDRCELLDSFQEGQEVEVHFKFKGGREWTSPQGQVKYFNSLQAWKLVGEQDVAKPPSQDVQRGGMSGLFRKKNPAGWMDATDDFLFSRL